MLVPVVAMVSDEKPGKKSLLTVEWAALVSSPLLSVNRKLRAVAAPVITNLRRERLLAKQDNSWLEALMAAVLS